MARGARAAKLENARTAYSGRRRVNRCWTKGPSRRAHRHNLSDKVETHRAERRAAVRELAREFV